jgi:hypothetical protein
MDPSAGRRRTAPEHSSRASRFDLTLGLSAATATTSLVSNLLNYPKADVIERRRLIGAERIIAVALAHNDLLNPMKDRFIVRFLNADSDELRPNGLPPEK